ncbi:DUF4112 domain-containing protein [Halobaculum sp. MBLA0143]|uniref:DUF4112 domain-containing protein n=1 Tax=Halobaculum sp. MBLA0143 TaxID=3079933 RepID=UPI0035255B0F
MDSAGGAREGIRVENRTDVTQRVDLDAGGASTTRRLDPGTVFVWQGAPRGGFDLRVDADDDRSVTTVPRGTDPSDVTVVVARDGVSVDLPGGTVTDAFATGSDPTDTTGTSEPSDTAGATDAFGADADDWGDDGGDSDPWTGGGDTPDRRELDSTGSDRNRSGSTTDTSRESTGGVSSRESTGGVSSRESTDSTSSQESTTEASSTSASATDESTRDQSTGPSDDTDGTDETGRTGARRPDETTPADDERTTAGSSTGADDATTSADTATPESTGGSRTETDGTATTPGTAAAATPAAADTPSPATAREAFAETVRVDERLDELESRAVWLDREFRIPGTNVRIGVSSIVGLLPGAGDGVMFLVALSLVYHGLRLGASTWTLMKMSFVLFVEFAVSVVPVLGDFVGAYWSANVQNVGYLRAQRGNLDGSTNWVFVLILFSPSILTFLAVVSLL